MRISTPGRGTGEARDLDRVRAGARLAVTGKFTSRHRRYLSHTPRPKMLTQTSTTDSNDFDGRFRRHFPRRSNDFALVVLKGHLLLEESVNHLLEALLYRPEAIEGAKFPLLPKALPNPRACPDGRREKSGRPGRPGLDFSHAGRG